MSKKILFYYDSRSLPEPGVGPFVVLADLPVGTCVLGMAPIGLRWRARIGKNGLKPEGNCPLCEFAPTHAIVGGSWREIKCVKVA